MTNTDFVWSRQAGAGRDGQEAAWTGRSRPGRAGADRQAGMNKLGTRLYLMPLPMMEA